MNPVGLQRKRTKGWQKPVGSVCVTRPGPWGNPFIPANRSEAAIRYCIDAFRWYLMFDEDGKALHAKATCYLSGKSLLCYCRIGALCHRDILLEAASQRLWQNYSVVGNRFVQLVENDIKFSAIIYPSIPLPDETMNRIAMCKSDIIPRSILPGRSIIGSYPSREDAFAAAASVIHIHYHDDSVKSGKWMKKDPIEFFSGNK